MRLRTYPKLRHCGLIWPWQQTEEAGRGRSARSPITIPANGWKDILWRTYTQIGEDRLLAVAAGAAFYILLALFPALYRPRFPL